MTAQLQTVACEPPALVVFGRDEAGKPHASSFVESEVALAQKAAGLMGMRVLAIATDAERTLAGRVPKGKLFASGKGFVPFVRGALYEELESACPPPEGVAPPAPAKRAAGEASATSLPPAAAKTTLVRQPKDWGEILVGSIVLTLSMPDHAEWYEAQVTAIKGDTVMLRFCDFPERPPVQRGRMEVGLLHPQHQPAPPLDVDPSSATA